MKNRSTIFIFLIILGVYAIIVANSIGKPLVADEWANRDLDRRRRESRSLRE